MQTGECEIMDKTAVELTLWAHSFTHTQTHTKDAAVTADISC